MKKFLKLGILLSLILFGFNSCELTEELQEDLTEAAAQEFLQENTDIGALIAGIYVAMHEPYMDQANLFALRQHTTDETVGPTRGGDWDDNGIWRVLHTHTWDAEHAFNSGVFDRLLQVVFSCTNALTFNPGPEQGAEIRMLRAFVMFTVADLWNQVPFREPGGNLLDPPNVLSGSEALDFVISECESIMSNLPDGPTWRANKDAAKVLLMKSYLNRGTFADRESPAFPEADMAMVIEYADEIIDGGAYAVDDFFYQTFAPDNGENSSELIFTYQNVPGVGRGTGNSIRSRYFCTLHYNMNPSGWNGFTTIADFYDKFDPADERLSADYPGITDVGGLKMGFLLGQQFDQDGNPLESRVAGQPLAFSKEVNLIETGDDFEITGIRVVKYPPDYFSGENMDNDAVFYRYSDVLLMKAEALLRSGGSVGTATDLVNEIRDKRGVADLGAVDLESLYDERGFELYWEEHRRTDMIRFGKFLDAYNLKPATGPERLLFPIPAGALAVNPNLMQNPGY